ncbi:PREDICTED: E3 ubiquitin-protein ligase SIAH2-like [Tinamus guttatus]|uniref:E3 ubiquitin-protein ligase SIAH2-like n=1 Tax=Tinamus guttatus TaxID=94827 RepID=UPI00052F27F9|nr:PREDICTED: E3 ubiquitin-protein ligase SIAH2-like [Tinamus guttatus]
MSQADWRKQQRREGKMCELGSRPGRPRAPLWTLQGRAGSACTALRSALPLCRQQRRSRSPKENESLSPGGLVEARKFWPQERQTGGKAQAEPEEEAPERCSSPSQTNLHAALEEAATRVDPGYATTGCSLTLHHTEKPEHEDICEYRPYSCPCPGASCKWQGSLEAVMSHLMHAHKSITTLQGEDIVFLATDINLPGAVDWVMMQSCFGHHFMLVLEKQEKYEGHQQFFAIVLLIGTRKQAENFAYRLELNGNRRRLTWEATPRSIHDGVSAAILNSDCLVFDTAIAHLFADNGNLGINVTISTCCP